MQHAPLTAGEAADRLRGIGLLCAAVATFTVLDTCAKYAGHFVPPLEVAWARYFFSVLLSVAFLRPWRRPAEYATRRPILQIVRSAFLAGSTVLNFIALQYLQLAETASITFAMPLFVTALAGPVLGEWPGPRRWAAVVVGFIGVLIVMRPTPATFHPAMLLSVVGAAFYAGYSLTTRLASATESPAGMLIYGSLLAALILSPAMPVVGALPPTWVVAAALVTTGLTASIGHWFLIAAHRLAPPAVLAPFNYTQLLWMVAAGYLTSGDIPTPSTLIGAAVIVASGLYVLYRERVHRDR
ncbi:DMT family transporter [soil metagenome]